MNRYAVIVGNSRVLTVYAKDARGAKEQAHRQLDKPGRRGVYRRWKESGKKVEECEQ